LTEILEPSWRLLVIALLCLGGLAALGSFVRLKSGGSSRAMLSMVLNNMTQGVVMFDDRERLVVCNERYVDMYGLSRNVVKPGLSLVGLIDHRKVTGSLNIDPKKYRADILAAVREATALPIAVGFGISSPAQAAAVGRLADGVVVGSALVDTLGAGGVPALRRFLGELRAGLDLTPALA
jgi:hypothetical protein